MSNWVINGYAARWGRLFRPSNGGHFMHSKKCLEWDASTLPVWFLHQPGRVFVRGIQDGLRLWQDENGLAFSITPRSISLELHSLILGIADGRYCECSASFWPLDTSDRISSSGPYQLVNRGELTELSICPRGSLPGTGAWLANRAYDVRLLPANVREPAEAFARAQAAQVSRSPISWAAGSMGMRGDR